MTTLEINQKNIQDIFKDILKSLSEKEKDVIEKRIWLNWEKQTLQSIWNSFTPNITRERDRQIEDSWIKKIGRIIKATILVEIQEFAKKILDEHGWLLTKDKLVNAIIKWYDIQNEMNSSIIETIVQSDYDIVKSKPKLGTVSYFYLPKIAKKQIDMIHKEALNILSIN